MATFRNNKLERQYYIDWLRILLIISEFLFHIGMIFNTWPWPAMAKSDRFLAEMDQQTFKSELVINQ